MARNLNLLKNHSVPIPDSKNMQHSICQLQISLETLRALRVLFFQKDRKTFIEHSQTNIKERLCH